MATTTQTPAHVCGTDGCGKPIVATRRGDLDPTWAHTDGTPCHKVVLPKPRCPDCGGHDVTTVQEAWCDRTTCPCGYQRTYMIGD